MGVGGRTAASYGDVTTLETQTYGQRIKKADHVHYVRGRPGFAGNFYTLLAVARLGNREA